MRHGEKIRCPNSLLDKISGTHNHIDILKGKVVSTKGDGLANLYHTRNCRSNGEKCGTVDNWRFTYGELALNAELAPNTGASSDTFGKDCIL